MMNNGLAQAIGTGISAVPVFFLVFDLVFRLMQIGQEKASFVQRDYPVDSAVTIGLLALVSIALLHGFVYAVGFAGQEERPGYAGFALTFLHFTIAGYGIALLVSLYVLWTFGRTVDVTPSQVAMTMVVLGFPASLGAATARPVV